MADSTRHIASRHRDLEVTYVGMNARTRDEVASALEPLLWIVPPWCRSLHIRFEQLADDIAANCHVDDEYRQASIVLDPTWLADDDGKQREHLCHELVHILLQPIAGVGGRMLESVRKLIGNEAAELLHGEWVRSVEMVTSDLDRTLAMVDPNAIDQRRYGR